MANRSTPLRAAGLAMTLAVAAATASCQGAMGDTDEVVAKDATGDLAADFAPADTSTLDAGLETDSGSPDAVPVDTALEADAGAHVCPAPSAPRDCSKGPGKGTADECHDAPSCYVAKVQKAVNDCVSAHPEWFDTTGSCPIIKDVDKYLDTVVASLVADGLCAIRDPNAPGEEVTVKKDNAFSENFDIVASTGCARSGSAIYTGYCAPAWW